MYKHFVFKDSSEIIYTYGKGDQVALSDYINDYQVQEKNFPNKDALGVYSNPIVAIYETEDILKPVTKDPYAETVDPVVVDAYLDQNDVSSQKPNGGKK